MANFFIKRPIFAIVVALVVSIAGLLAVFSLPVDRYPASGFRKGHLSRR